jgi:hypothetical protein
MLFAIPYALFATCYSQRATYACRSGVRTTKPSSSAVTLI